MVGLYHTQSKHMFPIVLKREGDLSVVQLEPKPYTPWWDHSALRSFRSADAAQLEVAGVKGEVIARSIRWAGQGPLEPEFEAFLWGRGGRRVTMLTELPDQAWQTLT